MDLAAGTAVGGPTVGIDTFTGVNAARGSEFNDVILGRRQSPIRSKAAEATIYSMAAAETTTLTGGDGSDIFVYATGPSDGGADTITDFDASEGDRIDLRAFWTIHNTADLLALSTQSGASATLINFGSGNTLTVQGTMPSTLLPSRFIFNGMVAVTVQTTAGFDFSRLYDDIAGANPSLGTHDSTHFSMVNTAAGVTINLIGSFSYDGDGNVLPGAPSPRSTFTILSTTSWSTRTDGIFRRRNFSLLFRPTRQVMTIAASTQFSQRSPTVSSAMPVPTT